MKRNHTQSSRKGFRRPPRSGVAPAPPSESQPGLLVVAVDPSIVVTTTLHDPPSQPELFVVLVTPSVDDTETVHDTEALLETVAPAEEVTVVPIDMVAPLETVAPSTLACRDSPDTAPVAVRTPTTIRAARPSAAAIFIPSNLSDGYGSRSD